MRQLIHVAYKLAALKMDKYYKLLEANEKTVSKCVYENMYDRHICRLFDIEYDFYLSNSIAASINGATPFVSLSTRFSFT